MGLEGHSPEEGTGPVGWEDRVLVGGIRTAAQDEDSSQGRGRLEQRPLRLQGGQLGK